MEETLKSHRIEEDKIVKNQILTMNEWCSTMNKLENDRNGLMTMQQGIKQQSEQFKTVINLEKTQFSVLEKENNDRIEAQKQFIQNEGALRLRLNKVDEKLKGLVMERQEIQDELNKTQQNIQTIKQSNANYVNLKQQYIATMSDRIKNIQQTKTFLPVITTITDRYNNSIIKLRNNLKSFENDWKLWNKSQLVSWFKNIENGRFNDVKYKKYINHIISDNICGKDLLNINELSLSLFGIQNNVDRQIILKNIYRLTRKHDNKNKNAVNALFQAIELMAKQDDQENKK